MVSILQKEHATLRQIAKEVPLADIGTKKLSKILRDMKKALASQEDGVAIAAPQIGVSLRIFIVAGKVTNILKDESEEVRYPDRVFINPRITKLSKEKKLMEEGCLSVRRWYGKVERSAKAYIEALDENGVLLKHGGPELMAQIFQHEIDHLNGILFTDTATDLKETDPTKTKEKRNA